MKDYILPVILAALGSSAFFGFIQFLIQRRDSKKGAMAALVQDVKDLKTAVGQLEVESCRVQLMTLIHTNPRNAADILTLALHYFVDLNGDTYLTALFSEWLKSQNIDTPIWFKGEHQ